LSVAAGVAWRRLPEGARPPPEVHLPDALCLIAAALAQLAVVHLRGAKHSTPLPRGELERRLLSPALEGGPPPNLDSFAIRRGDLRAAIDRLAAASDRPQR